MKSVPSTFQLVILTIFILVGIVGVVVFAGFGGVNNAKVPTATIWGTVDASNFNEMLRLLNADKPQLSVTYIQKNPETFQEEFVNALAEGAGPDVVLLTDDLLYSQRAKLMLLPYTTMTQREYSDTYLNGADYFLTGSGILGIPFTVDPIVMYYNRTMFSTGGIAQPPKLWRDVEKIIPEITRINDTKGVVKATVALGEARNINNAKEILITMLMQAGNNVTAYDPQQQVYKSIIDIDGTSIKSPGVSVLEFFTKFSNPTSEYYTWNRSMPTSRKAFISGDLAMYFGYASEYQQIRLENPNLDFDVAPMPQNTESLNVTYGKITAFSIVRQPKNAQDAFDVIMKLTEPISQKLWVDIAAMPPVRKDLLSDTSGNKFLSVFYKAAIQTKTWADPNPTYSATIFQDMIESITAGKSPISDAITTARQRLDLLLQGVKS